MTPVQLYRFAESDLDSARRLVDGGQWCSKILEKIESAMNWAIMYWLQCNGIDQGSSFTDSTKRFVESEMTDKPSLIYPLSQAILLESEYLGLTDGVHDLGSWEAKVRECLDAAGCAFSTLDRP
ncbi:MAG: hypothetical protein C0631_02820 [Sedimenticola sp.]|nr:MAG: hypothetical protein C0631_02820 [Sedimenticola sp.]